VSAWASIWSTVRSGRWRDRGADGADRHRVLAAEGDRKSPLLEQLRDRLLHLVGQAFGRARMLDRGQRDDAAPEDLGLRLDVEELHVGARLEQRLGPLVRSLAPRARAVVGHRQDGDAGALGIAELGGKVAEAGLLRGLGHEAGQDTGARRTRSQSRNEKRPAHESGPLRWKQPNGPFVDRTGVRLAGRSPHEGHRGGSRHRRRGAVAGSRRAHVTSRRSCHDQECRCS
jgi:hypothetical protein